MGRIPGACGSLLELVIAVLFISVELIVPSLMIIFPALVMVPAEWFGG